MGGMGVVLFMFAAGVGVAGASVVVVLGGLDWLFGWFGDIGPMYAGRRRHRRYLARLQQQATADADFCDALLWLTPEDRTWLSSTGWQEPAHAKLVRLNGWRQIPA